MQGRSEEQRELLDVESVAGHLLPTGSVFAAFLASHRRELFPDVLSKGRPLLPEITRTRGADPVRVAVLDTLGDPRADGLDRRLDAELRGRNPLTPERCWGTRWTGWRTATRSPPAARCCSPPAQPAARSAVAERSSGG